MAGKKTKGNSCKHENNLIVYTLEVLAIAHAMERSKSGDLEYDHFQSEKHPKDLGYLVKCLECKYERRYSPRRLPAKYQTVIDKALGEGN